MSIVLVAALWCTVDPAWTRARFIAAFTQATPANAPNTIFTDVPTLSYRAVTYWENGKWHVLYNSRQLCPDENDSHSLVEYIQHVAVHEACHVVNDGERLKKMEPIGVEERMVLERRAESCAFLLMMAWKAEE